MKKIVDVQKVIKKIQVPLTPSATKIIKQIKDNAANYIVQWNGMDLYEAKGPHGGNCVVNLTDKVCSCRKWEFFGMTCKHALACIHDMANNEMDDGLPSVDPAYRLPT
ncbi:mutator type transposase [Tanacetum coccineum]